MIESLALPKVNTFTPAMIALLPPLLQTLCVGFLDSQAKATVPKRLSLRTLSWQIF
jgi:hypothetical protein